MDWIALRQPWSYFRDQRWNMAINLRSSTKPHEPILEHEIRLRAYDIYERRGRLEGHALDDWLKAESEVLLEKVSPRVSANKA